MQNKSGAHEKPQAIAGQQNRQDIYTRVTGQIITNLEKGVRL